MTALVSHLCSYVVTAVRLGAFLNSGANRMPTFPFIAAKHWLPILVFQIVSNSDRLINV